MNSYRLDIEQQINDIYTLIHSIKDLDELIESFKNTDLEDKYTEQMMNTIDQYKESHDKLRDSLKEYFQYEKDNGLVTDFNFRKLFQVLCNTKV